MNKNRIWGLDFLRALAVTGVVLSHLPVHTGVNFLHKLFPIGPVLGVEIFFVLSGFLIGQIIIKQLDTTNFDLKVVLNFMKRRWQRTLPNYYFYFLVMLWLQWNIGKNHIFEFATFTQNLISKPINGFFGVTWSLTIEEIFYLILPILLISLYHLTNRKKLALTITITLLLVGPLALRFLLNEPLELDTRDHRQAALLRLDAIGYGVLMAFIKFKTVNLWRILSHQRLLLLLPLWYIFLFNKYPRMDMALWHSFYFPVMSIAIAFTIPYFDSIKKYHGILAGGISHIAKISYSLYLCHIPTIIISNKYIGIKQYLDGYSLEAYYLLTSIVIATLSYQCIEKRFMLKREN